MIWLAQVRQMIEEGFEPMACECIICADASLTVRIYDQESGRVDLMVTGIATTSLKSIEEVRALIGELHDELASAGMSLLDFQPSSQA